LAGCNACDQGLSGVGDRAGLLDNRLSEVLCTGLRKDKEAEESLCGHRSHTLLASGRCGVNRACRAGGLRIVHLRIYTHGVAQRQGSQSDRNNTSFGHIPIITLYWFLIGLTFVVVKDDFRQTKMA
jgi:hypothetical protein